MTTNQSENTIPPGRIDIHSHLLPGIDDGCETLDDSLDCVRQLIAHGYIGTICTPHCWPLHYTEVTPVKIMLWRNALQQNIDEAGLDYRLWSGGELRIYPDVVEWMQVHGVPTLAESKYVLCDFWEPLWQPWIDDAMDWLLAEGYTPILAHPERSPTQDDFEAHLDTLTDIGVLLQGNFRCFTGEEGYHADQTVRQYMDEGRYALLALDMHRPNTLPGRLDGIEIASKEYGAERIEGMIDAKVRELIFGI